MQVKLKVIGGKNDGREINLSIAEFIIGRGEHAHLRPSSDLVSREHCAIRVDNGRVVVEDLGSRNGTFINGEQIQQVYVAHPGDILRVGRLQFELVIDHVQPGAKKPKVQGVAEAAVRAAAGVSTDEVDEESITDWLTQANDKDEETNAQALRETRQFRLDETPTKLFVRSDELKKTDESTAVDVDEPKSGRWKKKKKQSRLPNKPNKTSESSKLAADEVLRRFFNRR